MAPQLANTRLRKELIHLKKDPPPGLIAEPNEDDILLWHYAIRGPLETPYEDGVYIGKIKFPSEYPLKAPSIYMLTPSGRFQCGKKICMSMTDFHPESWNPMWSVATIIQGIQSFMASDELTTGGLNESETDRKKFASASAEYNQKNFPRLFGGNLSVAFAEADEARKAAETNRTIVDGPTSKRRNRRGPTKTGDRNEDKEEEDDNNDGNHGDVKEQGKARTNDPGGNRNRQQRNAKKRAKQKAKRAMVNNADADQDVVGCHEIEKLAINNECY